MLRKIDRVLIRVPALDAAVRYYRDLLGLKLIRQEKQVASFGLDGCELVIHVDPDLPGEAIYYLVDSVRDLYKRRAELKLQFVGPPVSVARGFRAIVKDPFGTVLHLLDRTSESTSSGIEDAKAPTALFANVEHRVAAKKDVLIKLYQQIGRTADDLPYTPHFESLYGPYVAAHSDPKPSRAEVWRHLLNLRKAGKLPKLGEARSKPPDVDAECRTRLRQLLGKDIGKRDRLPYTERFDQIVDEFNKSLPRPLAPHLVWRLIATIAK
jgi:catechol 2,3-dioxygenase-like lactoylglutathione lyase family enzyme